MACVAAQIVRGMWTEVSMASIPRGPLHVIDHEEVPGTLGAFEFQSELFLHDRKD
jgi:hypothetical protein